MRILTASATNYFSRHLPPHQDESCTPFSHNITSSKYTRCCCTKPKKPQLSHCIRNVVCKSSDRCSSDALIIYCTAKSASYKLSVSIFKFDATFISFYIILYFQNHHSELSATSAFWARCNTIHQARELCQFHWFNFSSFNFIFILWEPTHTQHQLRPSRITIKLENSIHFIFSNPQSQTLFFSHKPISMTYILHFQAPSLPALSQPQLAIAVPPTIFNLG